MVIKIFTLLLLTLSLWAYLIPVESLKANVVDKDMPLVIFESPFMYTINENNISRFVQASHTVKYENRDEMFDADIVLINSDKTKNFKSEKLKADLIVKRVNEYTLTNNVKYTRDNFLSLNTEELFYDDIKKIAKNTKPYDGVYNNYLANGDTVYFDINNNFITSKNTHFEIKIDKKGKK